MGSNDFVIAAAVGGLALGLMLLLLGWKKYVQRKRIVRSWTKTQGTVIAVHRYTDSSPAPGKSMHGQSKIDTDDRLVHYKTKMYGPTVEYEASNGERFTLQTQFSSSAIKTPGNKVDLVYDPVHPSQAHLLEFIWFWAHLLLIFGSCVLLVALGAVLVVATM